MVLSPKAGMQYPAPTTRVPGLRARFSSVPASLCVVVVNAPNAILALGGPDAPRHPRGIHPRRDLPDSGLPIGAVTPSARGWNHGPDKDSGPWSIV
jgi:hypothetical protein